MNVTSVRVTLVEEGGWTDVSVAAGTALSGTFAGYYDAGDAGAERTYFLVIGAAAILGGLVMVALRRGILTAFEGVQ